MVAAPVIGEDAVIGDLPDKVVGEAVTGGGLGNELAVQELVAASKQGLVPLPRCAAPQVEVKWITQHRRHLQQAPGIGGEPTQAGTDHPLDGGRGLPGLIASENPRPGLVTAQPARFDQILEPLNTEEGFPCVLT